MDLYKFHDKPEELDHHAIAHLHVPTLVMDRIVDARVHNKRKDSDGYSEQELKALAREPGTAYWITSRDSSYGHRIPQSYYRLCEKAIATDPKLATWYAEQVIRGPWSTSQADSVTARLAEKNIATDGELAYAYAVSTLKKPWPEGEAKIMKSRFAAAYKKFKAKASKS